MKVLDLCCKAGGMSMGYHQAGFDVTGVDIEPQPHYPFKFIQADALTLDIEFLQQFDLISASPNCQGYSWTKHLHNTNFPRQIDDFRNLLVSSGKPYVIENVVGARLELINPVLLCGTMFNLKVLRHRLFESNFEITGSDHPKHDGETNSHRGLSSHKCGAQYISVTGHNFIVSEAREAMGINWMNQKELSQAIPPAYSKYIGEQFLKSLK